jgi:hypothetical protein
MIKTAHSFKGISKQYKEMNPDEFKDEHTCDLDYGDTGCKLFIPSEYPVDESQHFHSFDTGEAR